MGLNNLDLSKWPEDIKEKMLLKGALYAALKQLGVSWIEVDIIDPERWFNLEIYDRSPIDRMQRQHIVMIVDLEKEMREQSMLQPQSVKVDAVEAEVLAIKPAEILAIEAAIIIEEE